MDVNTRLDVFANDAANATPRNREEVFLKEYYKNAKGAELYYEDTGTLNKTEYPIAEGDELYIVILKLADNTVRMSGIISTSVGLSDISANIEGVNSLILYNCRITTSNNKISITYPRKTTLTADPSITISATSVYIDQIWRIRV